MAISFNKLLRELTREEWRMHANMFGRRRVEALPITIFAFVLAGGVGLFMLNISSDILYIGLLCACFAFGLQTGTIGFISSELMKNQLGDVTSLLFSTRVHPVDERKMLLAFIIKDLGFYIGLFILPVTVGFGLSGVIASGFGIQFIATSMLGGLSVFVLGMGLMVSLTVLTNSRLSRIVPVVVIAGILYGVYTVTGTVVSPILWLGSAIAGCVALVVSVYQFDSSNIAHGQEQKPSNLLNFGFLRLFVSGQVFAVAEYTLRNIQRSSGGLLKIPVFGGIVVGVPMFVAALISQYTALSLSSFLLISVISGSIALPVYTWLFRSDSKAMYDLQPIDEQDFRRGKLLAYYVLTLPVFGFVLATLLLVPTTGIEVILGLFSYVAVLCYTYGILTVFAGRNPESSLFDSTVYMKVGMSVMALFLPLLVLSFYVGIAPSVPFAVWVGIAVIDCVGLLVGVVVTSRRKLERKE